VVHGAATFVGGTRIAVGDRSIEATDIVLATGSRPKLLPGVAISERVITSDEALWAERLPVSAIVIGAGAVGLEFASMYRSFGAEVTIVEALPQLAPLEDADVSKELARAFRKRGITSAAGAVVKDLKDTDSAVEVTYEVDNAPTTVAADICLIAIGRGPVTEGIGLEEAGVTLQEKGFVAVDESLRTTADHIWSVGDVAATPLQLAHVSFAEGIAVAERIAGLEPPPVDYVNVPRVTYCTPEVASVGLTEQQAREAGHDIETERLDLRAIGKAKILDEAGSVKVVAAAGGGPVLGVHMIGPHVTDLIAEAMLVTSWEATANDVAALIHPHPSLSEGFGEAMLALAGKALHSP
jgi:dihydrolipoamide dehydrogenase